VHGLAHLMIDGATDVAPGDVDHAARIARAVTAVLGVGLLPRAPAGGGSGPPVPRRRSRRAR
jgi:hypothetical protein